MLDSILIPEDNFAPYDDEVRGKANTMQDRIVVDLENPRYGLAFTRYLLLTHWPELVADGGGANEDRLLYNRYYWFIRFVRVYCAEHGADAGLEQQAFQILEHAMCEIDWGIVQTIEECVNEELGL